MKLALQSPLNSNSFIFVKYDLATPLQGHRTSLFFFFLSFFLFFFFFFLAVTMSPFCGATDTLCFGLRLTVPMGFNKARVHVMDPQSTLISKPRPGPNFTPWQW